MKIAKTVTLHLDISSRSNTTQNISIPKVSEHESTFFSSFECTFELNELENVTYDLQTQLNPAQNTLKSIAKQRTQYENTTRNSFIRKHFIYQYILKSINVFSSGFNFLNGKVIKPPI